ncbi:MAG: hypothetical protein ACI8X5_003141 [Planctomycetota bacterium]|jgi:hypothetical protein
MELQRASTNPSDLPWLPRQAIPLFLAHGHANPVQSGAPGAAHESFPIGFSEVPQKAADEPRDILEPFAQGWNDGRDNVESKEQVFPETTFTDVRAKVAIRCGHGTHVK